MRCRTPAPCALVDDGAIQAVSAPIITTPVSTLVRVQFDVNIGRSPLSRSGSGFSHSLKNLERRTRNPEPVSVSQQYRIGLRLMAGLIEAIDIKRKMFFEYENAPYHCLDVEISRPTARGGQTLVRVKMRNLLTRAVFDRTFKAGEKIREPDLEVVPATFLYSGADGYHFMDQESYETLTLQPATLGSDRQLLV